MKEPGFLIVGSMKSGTSSLADLLSQHEEIDIPKKKEIHFFDTNYSKGIKWYLSHFQTDDQVISGDATPTYCYLSEVPKRVFHHFPDIKIIWIFRNPVQRTYSNYWHAVVNGLEDCSFESAISRELEGKTKDIFLRYIHRSIYSYQVKKWLEYFPIKQQYFIIFEKLKNELTIEYSNLLNFLDLELDFEPSYIQKNPTVIPRCVNLFYNFRKMTNHKSKNLVKKIFSLGKTPGVPEMNTSIEEFLTNYFTSYNEDLSQLVGQDVNKYWSCGSDFSNSKKF